MRKIRILFVTIPLVVIGLFLFHTLISAQEESAGLVVTPVSLIKDVRGGVRVTENFRITNHRGKKHDIYMSSREYGVDENGRYYFPEGYGYDITSSFEQNGWLSYEPKEFTLEDGEGKVVTVSMELPEGMPTKGYYLELIASTEAPSNFGGQVGTTPELSIPIAVNYIGIGDEVRELGIVKFETDRSWYEWPPVNFETQLINQGNVHVIPVGQIFISRKADFKDNVGSLSFNPGKQHVLTDGGRIFHNTWNDGFITKDNGGNIHIDWNKLTDFRFGKYYAQLNVAWDEGEAINYITAITSFWIIPWKLLIIPIVLILILVSIILIKRKKKRGVNKYIEK